jgi:hypothetical protein
MSIIQAVVSLGLLLMVMATCSGFARLDKPQPQRTPAKENTAMQSRPGNLAEGPTIQPASQLLSWLEKNARDEAGNRRIFRLPVVVRFEDEHRLALGPAYIGVSEASLGSDRVALALDDTGLKVSLLDQLNQRCTRPATVCALWLEGYWGPLVQAGSSSDPPDGDKTHPFAVLAVGELIDPTDVPSPATTRVLFRMP